MASIAVSAEDVERFDLAITIACMTQSEHRFEYRVSPGSQFKNYAVPDYFYSTDGCLVLSFDCGWYPFLDNTRGYNRGPQRWYVPKISQLLSRIAIAMQAPQQKRLSGHWSGGRVFLHADCHLPQKPLHRAGLVVPYLPAE